MKVTTVGSAMIDSIAIIDDALIERVSMTNAGASYLLLEQGRKLEAKEISQHCGGGGLNAAVGLRRLGFETALLAKVGDDRRADRIEELLQAEGVSADYLLRDGRDATGSSVLIGSHDRDLSIFTYRGANTLLCAEDVTPKALEADLVYIAPLSNEAADAFPTIVNTAKANGAKVAANPGVRQLTRKTDAFLASLDKIDILSMNRAEAGCLAPRIADRFGEGGPPLPVSEGAEAPSLAKSGVLSSGFDMSLRKYAASIRELGVAHLLITDGAEGAYASDGEMIRFQPARPAEVVGTVGAGDAFASTFAGWLCESGNPTAALRAAAENSAAVVGHIDAQSGLLARKELEDRLECSSREGEIVWALRQ